MCPDQVNPLSWPVPGPYRDIFATDMLIASIGQVTITYHAEYKYTHTYNQIADKPDLLSPILLLTADT